LEAEVSITGAFDDACASYFGGVVITDNIKRKIIKHFKLTEKPSVLFYVPSEKNYTITSNIGRIKSLASVVKIAYDEALRGNYWAALTVNGLIYSSALGYDTSPAIDAIAAGAFASGLSGTGPAVCAIVPEKKVDYVKESWLKLEGRIIETRINTEKARVLGK
jgi:shikimate kinase